VFAKKIGIDLGTSSMRTYVRGEGMVVDEPSVAAVEARGGGLLAVGRAALEQARQAPRSIRLVRPVRDGSIADLPVAERVLEHLVSRAQGRQRLFRPEVMICVHAAAGGDDRRALIGAAMAAGARQAWLIEAPLAAALGLGLPVAEAAPHAVCDLGGGTTQAAVISLSGVVAAEVVPVGGERLDLAIAAMVRERHGLPIDGAAAEALKLALGSALPVTEQRSAEVRWGDQPPATVTAQEVAEAIQPPLEAMADVVRRVLAQTPAPLAAQLASRGFLLVGGGALLRGVDGYLASTTGVPARVAPDPRTCAVRGTRRALGEYEVLHRRQLYMR
jgi:rod shape-determining protein MreB and related proteins